MKNNIKRLINKLNRDNLDKLKQNSILINKKILKKISHSKFYDFAKKKIAILKIELDILNRKLYVLNRRKIYPYLSQKKLIVDELRREKSKKIYFYVNHDLLPKLNRKVEGAINFLTIEQGEETWSNLESSRKWNKIIIWTFVSFASFGLVWSVVARVDETVQSTGKLEPKGTTIDVKVPLGGVIQNILVKEGDLVKKDQILLKLDTTAARAKLEALQRVKSQIKADILLSKIQLGGKEDINSLTKNQKIKLDSLNNEYQSRIGASVNAVKQIEFQKESIIENLKSQQEVLQIREEILKNLKEVTDIGGLSKIKYLKEQQEVIQLRGRVESTKSELEKVSATLEEANNKLKNTIYGAELSLQATMSNGEIGKISISRDEAAFRTDLENLIGDLNTVKTSIKELTSRGLNGSQGGPLAGDTRATQIALRLEKITTTAIEGFGQPLYLSQLGVRTELDGTLSFDEATFQRSMQNTTIKENFREIIFGIGVNTDATGLSVTSDRNKIPSIGTHSYQIEAIENNQYQISIGDQTFTPSPNADGNIVSRHTEGNFKGLTFTFGNDLLTSESTGTFQVGVGFVPNFRSYIEGLLGPSGGIAKHTETYEDNLKTLQAEEQSLEERQESLTDRYNLEFGRMETAISNLKRQGEYITSLMDMWTNYNK